MSGRKLRRNLRGCKPSPTEALAKGAFGFLLLPVNI